MSDAFPVPSNAFTGGTQLTDAQRSSTSGRPALFELVNLAQLSAESVVTMSGAIDLSAALPAVVAEANRRLITNTGAARTFTLPDFDGAPDGWEQMFISLDAATNELTIAVAGTDTINAVNGDVVLTTAAHEWVHVFKIPGATGWFATAGTLPTPA